MEANKKAILIACFGWYQERLVYIDEYLKKRGYETIILLSDFSHSSKQKDTKYSDISNIQYVPTKEYQKNLSIKRLSSHTDFSHKVRRIVEEKKPNLVYSLIPPNSLTKDLATLKPAWGGYRLVFDIIDLWPESMPISITNRFPFTLWGDRRNKYIDCADIVVLECMYYKTVLEAYVRGDKFREFSLVRKPLEIPVANDKYKDDGIIRLAYLGSINSLIDIDKISGIIKELTEIAPVEVRIIGKGDNKEKFIDAVKTAGGKPIDYGALYGNDKKEEIFHYCHFGLNVYKQDVKIGLTMKSVDYIQFGLPMLNTIAGDTEELIDQYGIGINVHRDEMDLNAVLSYVNNRENKREAVLRCFEEKFSSENVEERLRFLDEVI